MKNKLLLFFCFIFFSSKLFAEDLLIEAKKISINKNSKITIFEDEVVIKTQDNNTITTDYAEYNKQTNFIKLERNIIAVDTQNNLIQTEYAEYNGKTKVFTSKGPTKVTTTEKYIIEGSDIILNNNKNYIISEEETIVTDVDNNQIFLENFKYEKNNNIFTSIGNIKIFDNINNTYEFSQIYIDTKKKEILGTDIKTFLNSKNFKLKENNDPRIFANTIKINKQETKFNKSVFTLCKYRKNDKCPPWSIQASEMLHDSAKKTIFYNNAVIKVYNIPIFYLPKLSHPDPTVDRRSGFLPPSISSSKNLGSGVSLPYFFAVSKDRNFTLTNRFFVSENPLFLGEYHQAFKDSSLIADFGFTEGYKKTNTKKRPGDKSHFFSKYVKNFVGENNSNNSFKLAVQNISHNKYLKLYKIDSNLVDYNQDLLENSLDFTHEKEDFFFGLNASVYESLKDDQNDKYEYLLPEITLDKNLFSDDKLGNLDFQTNLKVHNYDTNKLTNFIVNDFNWSSKEVSFDNGLINKFLGNIRNINYEAKNVDLYKKDPTNELHGSLGLMSKLKMRKNVINSMHLLEPRVLIRYAPGGMRKESDGSRLDPNAAFSMDRLSTINNYESGLTGTLGLDYSIKDNNKNFDFSVAQIISEKENKKMDSKTGMDEKLSDLVGTSKFTANEKFSLEYNFALDENYNDLNYNEIGTNMNFGALKFDFDYLQEKKHIGDQDYFKAKVDLKNNDSGLFSFETKRNLISNSAEFYNLSYEYLNDCLRAGLVYRREFYNDSELEPENSLMFKITLTPFGNINAPTFSQ